MKTAGIILFILGIAGTLIFGIQALDQSESFQLFGLDIAVSKANWTPVIFSAVILAAGLILMISSRKSTTR
ncbi:MAG: transglycosylase [Mangrovibacterium sp.]